MSTCTQLLAMIHYKVSVNLDTVLAFVKSTRAALHGEFAKGA